MICPKCGSEMADGSAFCTKCGASLGENMQQGNPNMQQANPNMQQGNVYQGGANYGNAQQPYGMPYPQQQYVVDPKDHTAEFEAADISNNKVIAMLPYLMSVIGVILALLVSKESPYVAFHVRQALKISVCSILIGILVGILCWTIIVPIAGGVCYIILFVVRIICFFRICSGKAKEAPIVSSLGFLK